MRGGLGLSYPQSPTVRRFVSGLHNTSVVSHGCAWLSKIYIMQNALWLIRLFFSWLFVSCRFSSAVSFYAFFVRVLCWHLLKHVLDTVNSCLSEKSYYFYWLIDTLHKFTHISQASHLSTKLLELKQRLPWVRYLRSGNSVIVRYFISFEPSFELLARTTFFSRIQQKVDMPPPAPPGTFVALLCASPNKYVWRPGRQCKV